MQLRQRKPVVASNDYEGDFDDDEEGEEEGEREEEEEEEDESEQRNQTDDDDKDFAEGEPVTPRGSGASGGVHTCDVCGGQFTRSYTLRQHQRSHTGEKPYRCSICGKTFSRRFTAARHKRTHTGEKPFKCSFCPARFAQTWHLSRHERSHTGERPYKCETCGRRFGVGYALERHRRIHRGDGEDDDVDDDFDDDDEEEEEEEEEVEENLEHEVKEEGGEQDNGEQGAKAAARRGSKRVTKQKTQSRRGSRRRSHGSKPDKRTKRERTEDDAEINDDKSHQVVRVKREPGSSSPQQLQVDEAAAGSPRRPRRDSKQPLWSSLYHMHGAGQGDASSSSKNAFGAETVAGEEPPAGMAAAAAAAAAATAATASLAADSGAKPDRKRRRTATAAPPAQTAVPLFGAAASDGFADTKQRPRQPMGMPGQRLQCIQPPHPLAESQQQQPQALSQPPVAETVGSQPCMFDDFMDFMNLLPDEPVVPEGLTDQWRDPLILPGCESSSFSIPSDQQRSQLPPQNAGLVPQQFLPITQQQQLQHPLPVLAQQQPQLIPTTSCPEQARRPLNQARHINQPYQHHAGSSRAAHTVPPPC